LAPGVRLHHDQARGRWVLLAPERMLVLEDTALDVLRLVDGSRDVAAIVAALAVQFAAPEADIEADVREMLADLGTRGMVVL
jgi:pyrroloquinoline quinone biosynthesis protein D